MKSKDEIKKVTDEKFNTILHLCATIFAILGATYLVVYSDTSWKYTAFSIYGFSLVFLFLASTLHHGMTLKRKGNRLLRKIDYSAVYLLIAGTFTPIALITLRGKFGWIIFGVTWSIAIVGILLKFIAKEMPKEFTNTIYVSMGWIGLVIAFPLVMNNLLMALWLLVGGIFYTIGSFIFLYEEPNPVDGKFGFHEIWHIFVILGALSHWFMMFFHVLYA